MSIRSEYMGAQLSGKILSTVIDDVIRVIKKSRKKFDAIAFRGMSGAVVAPAVAAKLGKPLILVRKDCENSHSSSMVEGCEKDQCEYIIIDDFVCSGATIKATIDMIDEEFGGGYNYSCVGVFLYSPGGKTEQRVKEVLRHDHNLELYVKFCLPAKRKEIRVGDIVMNSWSRFIVEHITLAGADIPSVKVLEKNESIEIHGEGGLRYRLSEISFEGEK
jgi:hypothetical protein